MGAVTLVSVAAILVSTAACADAWRWRKWNLFDDAEGDSVVTVAADGRAVYPVYRTYNGYRAVLVRLPALPDFEPPPVITRVRHVYGVPPPLPPPPPPPPATRYGAPATPAAPSNAAATAAAVAAAVARTILEAHGFSRDIGSRGHRDFAPPTDSRTAWNGQRDTAPYAGEDQSVYWQQGLQRGLQRGHVRGASWRR